VAGVGISVVVELCKYFGLLGGHGSLALRWFAMRVTVLLLGATLALLFGGFCQNLGRLLLIEVGNEPVGEGTLVVVGYLDHRLS
jgi:hypothetical protein